MGAVTDPAGAAEETTEYIDAAGSGDVNPSESNGVHGAQAGTVTDPTAADVVKPAINFSPAPPRIHRSGGSGGIFRGLSGGIHRGASGGGTGPHRSGSGGIGPHRGASGSGGGIYRGRSGGMHLPRLNSFSINMTRLPEEDAGVQMHLTKTEEVEDDALDSPRAIGDGDGDDEAPRKKKSRLRKHLTVVGACSLGFRLAEAVLSLIAIVVMCSNSQNMGAGFGTLRFNHFQGYRYLVAVNVCVFVYSTMQFIQLAYTVILGISFIPSILISTWLTFGIDQIFAYLLLSASTSAATVANMSYTGEMGERLCSRYDFGSFCARADAAVTMSFFTFLAMLSSTILAIYRIAVLLKEY